VSRATEIGELSLTLVATPVLPLYPPAPHIPATVVTTCPLGDHILMQSKPLSARYEFDVAASTAIPLISVRLPEAKVVMVEDDEDEKL
jgi:hypothetical protein